MGYGSVKLADRARLFDLMVLGRSGRVTDEPYSDAIEEALLSSGGPVLVAPVEAPAALGESIALAWNNSPEAAKAVAAAMPLLVGAREVHVFSVGETGADALAKHLAWYGVRAVTEAVYPVKGVGPGELVLAAARDHACDLLVMGGYGRAPWREMLFGGATRQIVGTSLLPLLLSH
jgi:nucleotide-binding universal stress UspA family protein